jgi:hypothetical protein
MKATYTEGPQAGENFKTLATAVFQAKKTTALAKAKPAKKTSRKASGKDKA